MVGGHCDVVPRMKKPQSMLAADGQQQFNMLVNKKL
jgi:hypothetical protein